MEIRDIIQKDEDRLFIVDPECYIIYTGDTVYDIKPFIRIGTWMNMPVELIPFVENIIIPDKVIGDPAREQFNIDIRHLPSNRYIGGRAEINRFLEFQKIFGLDLTNSSLVNIEKDIPELSSKEKISEKNRFIGVFYRDGNFKTLLNERSLFDLKKEMDQPLTSEKFNRILADRGRKTDRYRGFGMVILGHNPMWYHGNSFYPYLMPRDYFGFLSRLSIDPGRIKSLIYPSLNCINISMLLKLFSRREQSLHVYSGNNDIDIAGRLFPGLSMTRSEFNGMAMDDGKGMQISGYRETYNMKVTIGSDRKKSERTTLAYVKGSGGIKNILKDTIDAVIIPYTTFEDNVMLLRSSSIPYAIIDDGNRNISKLRGLDVVILTPGMQYEVRKYDSHHEILDDFGDSESTSDDPALDLIAEAEKCDDLPDTEESHWRLYNLRSLLRAFINTTANRKLSSQMKKAEREVAQKLDTLTIVNDPSLVMVILTIYEKTILPFISRIPGESATPLCDEVRDDIPLDETGLLDESMKARYGRILEDRLRLMKLLEIYRRSSPHFMEKKEEIDLLERAIKKRKKSSTDEKLSIEGTTSHETPEDVARRAPTASGDEGDTGRKDTPAGTLSRIPLPLKIALAILLIAAILIPVLYLGGVIGDNRDIEKEVLQSSELDRKIDRMNKKYNITISDGDIYRYANRVALANGYRSIDYTGLKENNPNWIYPENVFTMLDGQKVKVSKGDTLWNLSKNKLIEKTIRFRETMNLIQEAGNKVTPSLIRRAKKLAFTDEQKRALEPYLHLLDDENSEAGEDDGD